MTTCIRLLKLARWSGLAAMLGALLWIGVAGALAARPDGCIADECYLPGRSMRVWDDMAPIFVTALLLTLVGLVGLVVRSWSADRFGRLGRTGLILGVAGILTLLAAGLIQALFFGGDFPHMPLFVISGLLALMIGFLLAGIAILRAQVLPRWAAWPLVLGALLLLASNDQNARVLFWVPFGIAWLAVGYCLWSNSPQEERMHAIALDAGATKTRS